jgi:hypothetical protein
LDKSEAERLAVAAANVARWYAVPTLAQKTLDWISLGSVAFGVYAPRVGAMKIHIALETAAKREAAQRAAAARAGQPIPQPPTANGGPSVEPSGAPAARSKGNGAKPPPFVADQGLTLDQDSGRLSNQPLAMIVPEGGFTN